MKKIFLGVTAPLSGAKLLLSTRELKTQATIPIFLTILILFAGILSGLFYASDIISLLFGKWMNPEAGIINAVFTFLGYVLITVFVFLFSYFFAAVVSGPFNSVLAEKSLKTLNVPLPSHTGFKQNTSKFFKMLKASIIKSLVIAVLIVFLFIGSFIPGVSIIVLFLGLMLLAFDCIDYSLEVLEYSFSSRVDFLRNHIAETCGFAAVLGLVFLVPFINFLILPVAVVGGAYLVGQYVKK